MRKAYVPHFVVLNSFNLIMSAYVWCMCAWVQDLQKAEECIISSGARLTGSLMWVLELKLRTSEKIGTFSYLLSHPIHIHFYFILLETIFKRICSILRTSNILKLPWLSHVILSIYPFFVNGWCCNAEHWKLSEEYTSIYHKKGIFFIILNFCCHSLTLEPHTNLHFESFHDGQGKVELLWYLMIAFTSLTV